MSHNTNESSNDINSNVTPVSGGIFSTPDLTVSSENVPENLVSTEDQPYYTQDASVGMQDPGSQNPAVNNANSQAMASVQNVAVNGTQNTVAGGAPDGQMNINHDTPEQVAPAASPDMPDIVRAPGRSSRMNSSVTKDLVLPKTPKQPGKSKAPIILAVVVLLALAIGGTTYMIMGMNKSSGDSSQVAEELSAESLQKLFNRHATYLLFEKSQDSLSEEYNPSMRYKLEMKLPADAEDAETYWQTVISTINEVVEKYEAFENHDDNLLVFLKSHQSSLDFLNRYHQTKEPSGESLLKTYLSSGAEAAKQSVHSVYEPFLSMNYASAKNFANLKIAQYDALVDLFELYNNAGCALSEIETQTNDESASMFGDRLSIACQDVVSGREEDEEALLNTSADANWDALTLVNSIAEQVTGDCWQISPRFTQERTDFLEESDNDNAEEAK